MLYPRASTREAGSEGEPSSASAFHNPSGEVEISTLSANSFGVGIGTAGEGEGDSWGPADGAGAVSNGSRAAAPSGEGDETGVCTASGALAAGSKDEMAGVAAQAGRLSTDNRPKRCQ
jgi:hypothetical protein